MSRWLQMLSFPLVPWQRPRQRISSSLGSSWVSTLYLNANTLPQPIYHTRCSSWPNGENFDALLVQGRKDTSPVQLETLSVKVATNSMEVFSDKDTEISSLWLTSTGDPFMKGEVTTIPVALFQFFMHALLNSAKFWNEIKSINWCWEKKGWNRMVCGQSSKRPTGIQERVAGVYTSNTLANRVIKQGQKHKPRYK